MVDNTIETTNPLNEAEFDRAFELLQELVDLSEANEIMPSRSNAVFTASVVLWMLVYQRLKPDASLEAAVKHLLETHPTYLPENKRLAEGTLSSNSGSYSRARSRLTTEVVEWFAMQVSHSVIGSAPALLDDQRIFLIDGTTIALAPEKELQQTFPAAPNKHGEGIWPIALLVVVHELASGCALLPEIGAMYGENAVSETVLARQCFQKMPENSVVMADSGFGIFSVAYAAVKAGHDLLFRMTKARFVSLQKKATLVARNDVSKSYSLSWKPSAKDRKTNPHLPDDAVIEIRLHEVVINKKWTLYLVTSLDSHALDLSELFKYRVQVEFDIRNLKVVLGTENIRAKSVDMFKKELWTSVVAYNLVGQFRRQAAEQVNLPPRRMSFKRTWTTFQTFLLRHMHAEPSQWRDAFATALRYAMKDKLPNRPNRTAKREAYRKASKTRHFKKRKKPPSKLLNSDVK